MANLEGMPIGSLPEATSIQDEDEIVVYRPSTGKAYQANTDLIDSVDMFGTGKEIQSDGDLNDYTTLGKYYCRSTAIGATLSNVPFSGSFSLYVMNLYGSSSSYVQIITRNATGANVLYYRICQTGTWYSWYLVTGTAV